MPKMPNTTAISEFSIVENALSSISKPNMTKRLFICQKLT